MYLRLPSEDATASDVLGLSGGPPWRADLASWATPKWDERGYPRPWTWEKALALDASPGSAFIHCVTVDKLFNLFKENPISALSEKSNFEIAQIKTRKASTSNNKH